MSQRRFGSALFTVAMLLSLAAHAADEKNPVVAAALEKARQGHEDDAITALQTEVKASPKNRDAWILLGRLLDYVGKPEDAVATWESGVKSCPDNYELWLNIATLRTRQADDGPTVSYERGMVAYKPQKDIDHPDEFKKAHRLLAIAALEEAMKVRRNTTTAAEQLAAQYTAIGEHAKALDVWDALIASDLNNAEFVLGRAQTQWALNKKDDAVKGFTLALKLNPRLVAAHAALSEYYKGAKQDEQAAEHQRQAQFYEWFPEFAPAEYSKENFATFEALNPERNEQNGKTSAEAGKKRAETIERLKTEATPTSSDFLAALCWHHEDCGGAEDRIFTALGQRGKAVEPMLLEMIQHPSSTCTVRAGALCLARMKSEKLYPILAEYLPGDTRSVFHMDIAAALDELGDPRAVPDLIKLLQPEKEKVDGDGEEAHMFSRQAARLRAILALGAFKTDDARAALQKCLANPTLELNAQAALFRQTGDAAYADKISAKIPTLGGYEAYVLQNYFSRIDTDAARALAKSCKARDDAVSAEQERKRKAEKEK